MVELNIDKLVMMSVMGEVSPPIVREHYRISHDGRPMALPGVGGITYNVRIGDAAVGWAADHVEPGVSIFNREKHPLGDHVANPALNMYACIGNTAIVASGDAKGEKGCVTGKHGGIEHVLVDFPPAVMEKLLVGDRVQIRSFGLGMEIVSHPSVKVMNVDPKLLMSIDMVDKGGKLEVPVTHIIPATVMGSGLGHNQVYTGDYDIQLFDEGTVLGYDLGSLRFGDIVAIMDADHSFGRIYRKGAVTVGVVVHSACVVAGHGPGVTTILTCQGGEIVPRTDKKSNIACLLGVRPDVFK
jgi:hypothetical protein